MGAAVMWLAVLALWWFACSDSASCLASAAFEPSRGLAPMVDTLHPRQRACCGLLAGRPTAPCFGCSSPRRRSSAPKPTSSGASLPNLRSRPPASDRPATRRAVDGARRATTCRPSRRETVEDTVVCRSPPTTWRTCSRRKQASRGRAPPQSGTRTLDRRHRVAGRPPDAVTAKTSTRWSSSANDLEEELGRLSWRTTKALPGSFASARLHVESKSSQRNQAPGGREQDKRRPTSCRRTSESRLFKYLVDRKYGTPDYKKRGLTRRLGSLGREAGRTSTKSKQSYDFLRVTPELMAAEVDRRRGEFEQLMDRG